MNRIISLAALVCWIFCNHAVASYTHAPPSFGYRDGEAVFIDFKEASYEITYDFLNKTVDVETVINFYSSKKGYPIYDLIPTPSVVFLDGHESASKTISDPDKQTILRVVEQNLEVGLHQLKIKHAISTNVVFGDKGLASGFWMSDLKDRKFLEQYLPTNLEFDQYKMTFKVNVVGAPANHVLKANGRVSKISENSFEVTFPDFYTSSSVFFHLFPEDSVIKNAQFYYPSINGRLIPVDIYLGPNIDSGIQVFVNTTKSILGELEADFGPFPHDQVIIYGSYPSGGMEYSGATITSLRALGHELFHSYHARGLMPANGNAGWMDEAIARWRDDKYPLNDRPAFDYTILAGHSIWSRATDRMAYTQGSAFLSWIASRMNKKGLSFKTFLKNYFNKFKYTTVTTQLFEEELTRASGLELARDFDRYIYGKPPYRSSSGEPQKGHENPYHPILSEKELLDLTWL